LRLGSGHPGEKGAGVGAGPSARLPRSSFPAGGRCNFTNRNVTSANYVSSNPPFVKPALARYTPKDFIALVKGHSIAFHEKKDGQLFCDKSSKAIIQLLSNGRRERA